MTGQRSIRGPSTGQWQHQVEARNPNARFPAEKGRYHLYAAWFCPFAHRALVLRTLKGLDDVISISIVHWFKGVADDNGVYPGWHFETAEQCQGCIPDPLFNAHYLSEIYFRAEPNYEGKYSVPVLWDKKTNTIVNNESDQIMRMLSSAFDEFAAPDRAGWTYAPKRLLSQIDEESKRMQAQLNAGVYKAGFARKQEDYEAMVAPVFEALDHYEAMLAKGGPFLLGEALTELDVRFYATVIRFDTVYVTHFKCNLRTIRHGYPHISAWLSRLYERIPAFRNTTDFNHIKKNYFVSHRDVNGSGVVPLGPKPDVQVCADEADHKWSEEAWKGTYEPL